MDNISMPGSQPPNSSVEEPTVVEAQTVEANNQQNEQPPPAVSEKKRKQVEARSLVWDHFVRIKDRNDVTQEGRFVEGIGFRRFIAVACPRFIVPSRWTISRDILVVFEEEKLKLKAFLRESTHRVSITTDSWTSIQRINYMVVTAHFIDSEWKLHKRIIAFVPVTSHKGEYLAKAVETCLLEWGFRNVFTVTVDNASSNDTAMGFLKKKIVSWGTSTVKAKYIHMRCIAHILNLVVQDGLKECDSSVKKVREVVRYVRNSPARLKKFRDLVDLLGIEQRSSLCLDVPTKWNSTYLMLQSALTYQKVFESCEESDSSFKSDLESCEESDSSFKSDLGDCEESDSSFKSDLGDSVPSDSSFKSDLGDSVPDFMDWESVGSLVQLLKCFYDMTVRISGSLYVTANTFFSEISDLYCLLNGMVEAGGAVGFMGENMKLKFSKYWGDIDKMNLMIFYASILDPRDKLEYMPVQINHMYGEEKGKPYFAKVLTGLNELFDDYSAGQSVPASSVSASAGSASSVSASVQSIGRPRHFLKSQIKKQRFPILSKLARDVLAIPISTVASESAFSTSGRVLDPFKSSLTPKIVEALVCTQDWLRQPNTPLCIEENLEDLERFEKVLYGNDEASTNKLKRRIKLEEE
ncbi:zinc finger BED domain-containing protein RICESLEEPER 2-like [Ipomoea triloba]|uniref:zinc finger BED domain-containing protein RICESLEEPER 2-like n=1 Tax=Ipomoea triloba TaxID=35885 RepID=UPI00125DDA7E|nr:zinc finger BED domain-containing protein RICESLEEPER 2-like [Ipomoea triloba]